MEIVLLSPSIVMLLVPNVAIPVTLRSPLTTTSVTPNPTVNDSDSNDVETMLFTSNSPKILAFPITESFSVGIVVPIPRFPEDGINDNSSVIFKDVEPIPSANVGKNVSVDVLSVEISTLSSREDQIGVLFSPLETNISPSSPA